MHKKTTETKAGFIVTLKLRERARIIALRRVNRHLTTRQFARLVGWI